MHPHFVVLALLVLCAANSVCAQSAQSDRQVTQAIDGFILKELQANKIAPAPRADDADLLRRIYLDLLGRIPTPDEVRAWSQDAAPDKDQRLIDKLLDHPEMPLFWADVLDVWLNGREVQPSQGAREFRNYLRKGLETNKSWDRFARELLLPGPEEQTQPAVFFLGKRLRLPKEEQLDGMTVAVAAGFFGVRIECARCHDHPYVSEWTQDNYFGLASFLNRTQLANFKNKQALGERAEGEVAFETTKRVAKKAKLMFLDNKVFAEPPLSKKIEENYVVPPGKDGQPAVPRFSARRTLADYAFVKDNAYFARAMVNRIWKQLLGRGLVEPVDQIHEGNEASHPELLKMLSAEFADGFDLKKLIAVIMHSDTYRRSSQWQGEGNRPSESLYAAAILRPLQPEQLLHAVAHATGHVEVLRSKQKGDFDAVRLRTDLERDLKAFVDLYHSDAEGFAATTAQALFMTYNAIPQKYLQNTKGNLLNRLATVKDDAETIREAYAAILSRQPAAEERQTALHYLQVASMPREQRLRDLVWALLTSAEFRFNH